MRGPDRDKRFTRCLLPLLILAACGPALRPVDSGVLPPGVFPGPDQDVAAAIVARDAFADPSRTYGDPAAGARAALALEYEAGALNTDPRWSTLPASVLQPLLPARAAMRQAAGIAAEARSQAVADALLAALRRLQNGDRAGAEAALTGPAFIGPGAATVTRLANLPYLQPVNVATTRAAEAVTAPGDLDTGIPTL